MARAGYEYLPDQNGEFRDGYFPITMSNADEQRVSAAIGYLGPEVRARENLEISTDTQVMELLFEGLRCVGVKALVRGQEREFRANEVICSSGAIHSPAHLLREAPARARRRPHAQPATAAREPTYGCSGPAPSARWSDLSRLCAR